jgi:hypothetical protein
MGFGSGIRDPRSGENLFRILGSKRHRIIYPDPQHCLKHACKFIQESVGVKGRRKGPWNFL